MQAGAGQASTSAPQSLLLTVDFEDQTGVLAAPCGVCDGDHVVASVLQPQVQQRHGAVVVWLDPADVVHRDVGVDARLPRPDAAAHQPRHERPLDGRDARARHTQGEEDVLLN